MYLCSACGERRLGREIKTFFGLLGIYYNRGVAQWFSAHGSGP